MDGAKDDLFDAVLARTLTVLTESVPFTADADLLAMVMSLVTSRPVWIACSSPEA
jgi:hypothetical protein